MTGRDPSRSPRRRPAPVLLVIDNYDSFTYNLVQYLGELGADPVVRRNDAITVDDIGPSRPRPSSSRRGRAHRREAGITVDVIRRWGVSIPTLGVCLGHQAIGEAYGGDVVRADRVMHGKTSEINHDGTGVFAGLPSPMEVMRYHSLDRGALAMPAEPGDRRRGEGRSVRGARRQAIANIRYTACNSTLNRS